MKEAAKPADPISLLTREERAYIAGLVDGDGCLRIAFVGPRKQYQYPMFLIGMTHEGVLLWLRSKLETGTLKLNNHTSLKRNPRWKPQWTVRLHGRRAQLLCQALLPYLKVKREQAECIIEFPVEGRSGPGRSLLPEMAEHRRVLFERMRLLNKRGPA